MEVDEGLIRLISRDGTVYEVPRKVALMSVLIKETLGEDEDDCDDSDENADSPNMPDIPLPNVSADVLGKVIEYCRYYQFEDEMRPIQTPLNSNKLDELVQEWYAEYVKVDKNLLFDLVAAANFMDIKPLLDLTCLAVSILIKGKSALELREMFNISNELTAEEKEQITRDNIRAFDSEQQQQQNGATAATSTDTTTNEAGSANSSK